MSAEQPSDPGDEYAAGPGDGMPPRHGGLGDLSGDVGTVVTDPRGNVNSGSGTQWNLVVSGWTPPVAVRQAVGIRAVLAGLEFLHRVFVRPPGFEALRERLARPGSAIVLTGPPGSGRRAAAQVGLCPDVDGVSALRFLSSADLAGDERLTAEDISAGDRLLLDVSDLDSEAFVGRQSDLVNCVSIVGQQRASLVILVPDHLQRQLHDDLQVLRLRIEYPDRWAVLDAHLRHGFQLSLRRSSVSSDERALVGRLPLRDVARVAKYLDETRDQRLAGTDWLKAALAGLEDQEQAVIEVFEELRTVEDRTLLLTAAMLEAGSVDSVYFAERGLHAVLGYRPATDDHRLAQAGITDRIRRSGNQLRLAEGTVRFVRPAFGTALLDHFWDAYPDLRRQFAEWVSTSYRWPRTQLRDRAAIAERFTAQAVRTQQLSDLYGLVESWADAGREESRRLAASMMTQVLLDDRSGPWARQQLYSWAYKGNLSVPLGRIVIQLCTDVVAASHLKQALIRLRWLADQTPIRTEACDAIVRLCADNRGLELFIHVLSDGGRFDPALCRLVLSPARLAEGRGQRPALLVPRLRWKVVAAWRRVAEASSTDEWCVDWLSQHAHTAAGSEPVADALRAALIDICDRKVARLAQVFEANQRWLRHSHDTTPAARQAAAAAIEQAISCAIADLSITPRRLEGVHDEVD